MKTEATRMFGIEAPIFAFSHCRDVVVATSKAGGFGVLGAAWMTPEHLEQELKWIDDHIGGHSVDERQPFDAYIRLQACPRVVDACLQFHASRLGSLATAKRACRLEDVGHCIDHG